MAQPWRLKYWDGTIFDNAELKRWNGSSWVTTNGYYWDGSSWELLTDRTAPTTTYTFQYYSEFEWNQSYKGDNTKRNDSDGNTYNFQGFTSSASSFGRQRSMWGLPTSVHDDLSGATAFYYCRASIANIHTWQSAGGTAVIGTHKQTAEPSTFSEFRTAEASAHFDRGETRWVDMPIRLIQDAADGNFYGLTLHVESDSTEYYGYYDGRFTWEMSFESVV